jgi:YVTN family beta-propeller protein
VTYSAISGIELSRDGSLLAVCASFDDRLNLFDTATRTRIASVPVGDFPGTVAFNPAGTRAYVANAFSNDLTVVNIAGAASAPITTVPTGDRPFTINVDAAGAYVYIGNNATAGAIKVLDAATNAIVGSVNLGAATARVSYLSPTDSTLYVGTSETNGGHLLRIHAAGPASSITDSTPLGGIPSSIVFSEQLHRAFFAQPAHIPDGVDMVAFGSPCAADITGDGAVNVQDFLAFLQLFAGGDPRADFTGDGQVNIQDFLAFLQLFAAGC